MTHNGRGGGRAARQDKVWVPSKQLAALGLLVIHTAGSAHLQRRLYQKPFEAFTSLLWFLMDVLLVALEQGKLLIRIARRLQGDLKIRR